MSHAWVQEGIQEQPAPPPVHKQELQKTPFLAKYGMRAASVHIDTLAKLCTVVGFALLCHATKLLAKRVRQTEAGAQLKAKLTEIAARCRCPIQGRGHMCVAAALLGGLCLLPVAARLAPQPRMAGSADSGLWLGLQWATPR